jgi:hypothetical protein
VLAQGAKLHLRVESNASDVSMWIKAWEVADSSYIYDAGLFNSCCVMYAAAAIHLAGKSFAAFHVRHTHSSLDQARSFVVDFLTDCRMTEVSQPPRLQEGMPQGPVMASCAKIQGAFAGALCVMEWQC